jgi:hypothetical protein
MARRMTACHSRKCVKIVLEPRDPEGKKVNSHNSKSDSQPEVAVARVESDDEPVRVIKSNLLEADELSISDELDVGGDPYNSTGQHVILKMKQELPE